MQYENLINLKFNKLTAIEYISSSKWRCICDCGNESIVKAQALKTGSTKQCRNCGYDSNRNKRSWNNKSYKGITGNYWAHIKNSAKKRKIKFLISIQEAWELFEEQNEECIYSGEKLIHQKYKDHRSYINGTASLDRIDSNLPYTKENCQWIHKDINWMKNSFKESYFIEMCKKVAKRCQ